MEAEEKRELIRTIGELNNKIYELNQDEEKKELISIIGNLNNIIYEMKQEQKRTSDKSKRDTLSFAKLGASSPISSNSEVDFLEIERNAMNEGYEAEIRSLKTELEEEKEKYNHIIRQFQSQIEQLNSEKAEIQENLDISAQTIKNLNETIDEQNSKNLYLQGEKELIQANIQIDKTQNQELVAEYGKLAQENEKLRKQIEDLSYQFSLFESQLKDQIELNQKDRHFYTSEIQRITELSSSVNEVIPNQYDESELLEENRQLKQNYESLTQNYNKGISEKLNIQNEMIENRKALSNQIKAQQEQSAESSALLISLKSLFRMDNSVDILSEINRIYNEYHRMPVQEKTAQDLRSELEQERRKNMELQSIIDAKPLFNLPIRREIVYHNPTTNQIPMNDDGKILKLKNEIDEFRHQNEKLTIELNEVKQSTEATISQQKEVIANLSKENDELRGNVLSREELIHNYQCKIDDLSKQDNQPQTNYESQIEQLANLVEKLTNENQELKDHQQPNETDDSDRLIDLMRKRLFFISESMKQRINNPTPAIENLIHLINEIILLNSESLLEDSNQQFEVDTISIVEQMNADNQTLAYCIQQLTNAYQQSVSYTKFMKIIYKQIEELNTRIDGIYETVFSKLGYHEFTNPQQQSLPKETSFAASTGYEVPDDMEIMSMMQNQKRIPRTPDQPSTSFVSLLDSPKISRNVMDAEVEEQGNAESVTNVEPNPKSTFRSTSSSSRIPKFNPPKNSKLRKPLAVRQNNADPNLMSPRMAPSHIPEPTRNRNKF